MNVKSLLARLRVPTWRTLVAMQGFVAGAALGNLFWVTSWWLQILNAFLIGASLSGAFYAWSAHRMTDYIIQLRAAYDAMYEMNEALVQNRVRVHFEGMQDEPPPIAPRLH